MRNIRLLFAFLLLVLPALGCAAYRIPAADGTVSSPSPPSLEGVVVSASAQELTIRTVVGASLESPPVHVSINPHTAIFTGFGGYVQGAGTLAGKAVKVWFTHKKVPVPPAVPVAAAVEVAQ